MDQEDAVVERVANGVVRGRGRKEIARNELCTLVNKLVERVLTVGTSGTPDNGLLEEIQSDECTCKG